jgi:hypothetical protein
MLGKRIWICAAVLLLVAAIGSAAALTNTGLTRLIIDNQPPHIEC